MDIALSKITIAIVAALFSLIRRIAKSKGKLIAIELKSDAVEKRRKGKKQRIILK